MPCHCAGIQIETGLYRAGTALASLVASDYTSALILSALLTVIVCALIFRRGTEMRSARHNRFYANF